MPRLKAGNNASTFITQDMSSVATSFTVDDASNFPETPFLVTIYNPSNDTNMEIVEVGGKSGNTFSQVLRGREGTTATNHIAGELAKNMFTAGTLEELAGIEELSDHTSAAAPHSGHATTTALSDHTSAAAPHSGHATTGALSSHTSAAAPHSGHATTGALSSHTGETSAHSATSAATASRIMMRDSSGRAKVAAPSASDDIARKAEVDAVEDDLASHKADEATQTELGHIKLSDIPSPTIATQAEAEAGTNNTKFMTPLRTHQAIDSKIRVVDDGILEVFVDGEWITFIDMRIDDRTGAPGSKFLIGGDMQAGFFGEVSASELISGDALASEIGLSAGTSLHSTAGWLKFAWQGKILFVAKKAFRNSISWNHINNANAVYGDKIVEIGGLTYKVRLLKGANNDPAGEYRGAICHGSEWNRLMLPIHEEAINKDWAHPNNVESDIPVWSHNLGSGNQGMYTDGDLLTGSMFTSGSRSWCQEVAESSADRIYRGYNGVSYSSSNTSSNTNSGNGWRPCLELVN